MAEATQSHDITPGLLNLHHLSINRHKHSLRETTALNGIVGDQQMLIDRELKGRKFACAALNLCALVSYQTGDKEKATRTWKTTLEKDPSNLNALQDLVTIYKELKDVSHTEEYRGLLADSLNNKQDIDEAKARCVAEQAYAGFKDLPAKAWNNSEARRHQIKQFEDALSCREGLISQEEKRDWLLYKGQAHEKLAHAFFRAGEYANQVNSIKDALTCLYECLQMSKEPMHKSQVWCALGNTLTFTGKVNYFNVLETLPFTSPDEQEFLEMLENPHKCYKKALELDRENEVWILARWGILYEKKRNLTEALRAFDKSIQAAESLPVDNPMRKACRLAYDHRAMTHINKFKMSKYPNKAWLEKAKEDTHKALNVSHHQRPLRTSAEVHFLLAKLEGNEETKEQYLHTALIHIKEACECQDGESVAYTHQLYAEILQYMGNKQEAIEHFHTAFNLAHHVKSDEGVRFAARVANELLCATLESCQNVTDPEDLITYALITFQCIMSTHNLSVEERLFRKLLDILENVIRNPNSSTKFIERCLECVDSMENALPKSAQEKMVHISFLFNDLHTPSAKNISPLPGNAQNQGYDYDFYIIADDKSKAINTWVKGSFLPRMEQPMASLKGYVHNRDSKLGSLEVNTQGQAMTRSCFILIVISSGFTGNKDCQHQAAMACKCDPERNEVVILQYENAEVPLYLSPYKHFDFVSQERFPQLACYMMPPPSYK